MVVEFIHIIIIKLTIKTLENIKASIVHNMEAPLLLGQTVLEGFGKISIDLLTRINRTLNIQWAIDIKNKL